MGRSGDQATGGDYVFRCVARRGLPAVARAMEHSPRPDKTGRATHGKKVIRPAVASAGKAQAWSEAGAFFLPSPADDLDFDSFDPSLSLPDDFSALACLVYSLER